MFFLCDFLPIHKGWEKQKQGTTSTSLQPRKVNNYTVRAQKKSVIVHEIGLLFSIHTKCFLAITNDTCVSNTAHLKV